MTPEQIAELLQRLAVANHALAAELDAIATSRRSLNQSTVDRLELLLEQMRPAEQIRQILAELHPQELLAGAREWLRRWPANSPPPDGLTGKGHNGYAVSPTTHAERS